MITQDEKIAQNELSADLLVQALHKKRVWLLVLALVAYKLTGSYYVFVVYMFVLLALMRFAPIKFYEKDQAVHIIFVHKIDRAIKILNKKIFWLISKYMAVFVLISVSFAQELPPPPPPPPLPSDEQVKEQVIEVSTENIKPSVLQKLVQSQMIRDIILRQEHNLMFGGHKEYYLKKVNYFSFHPSLPILIEFDKPIKDIYVQSMSAKVIFEDNYLFLIPNDFGDSKVLGFVVAFEDGSLAYFAGERVSDLDGIKDLVGYGDKLHKALVEGKKKVRAKERVKRVIVYYTYRTPRLVPLEDIVAGYLAKVQRCPVHNESFVFQGRVYRFIKKQDKFLRDSNEIYACGSVFAVELVQ